MLTPRTTEMPLALEPVTHDPFIDDLAPAPPLDAVVVPMPQRPRLALVAA